MTSGGPEPKPADSVGGGLQHERTALAWERTAIAFMVAGVAFTRVLSSEGHPLMGLLGLAWVAGGGWLLWWAASNDQLLHDLSAPESAVPQTWLTRTVGVAALGLAAVASILTVALVLT